MEKLVYVNMDLNILLLCAAKFVLQTDRENSINSIPGQIVTSLKTASVNYGPLLFAVAGRKESLRGNYECCTDKFVRWDPVMRVKLVWFWRRTHLRRPVWCDACLGNCSEYRLDTAKHRTCESRDTSTYSTFLEE